MGNLYAESGFNSINLQNSFEKSLNLTDQQYTTAVDNNSYTNFIYDKAGYGLAQWTFWSLKKELYDYAKLRQKSIGDFQMQVDFLWEQLNHNYKFVVSILKTAVSIREASDVVLLHFERPADQSIAVREKRANFGGEFYKKYSIERSKPMEQTFKEIGNGYIYESRLATQNKYWNLPAISVTGFVLHSIGTPQPSAETMATVFNKPTAHASVHGFIEPGKYIETAETRLGIRKAKKCYHVGGNWNSSRIGIEMCEPSCIEYTGGATFKVKDPAAAQRYIIQVTETAAQVLADLCIYHKLTVASISTHAEAHRLGQGSGHADPEHLWKYINYTLADFRKDVQKIIDSRKGDYTDNMTKQELETVLDEKFKALEAKLPQTYQKITDVPEWGRATIQKCMALGIIQGEGNGILNITNDLLRTLVINDRAGIYNKSKEA